MAITVTTINVSSDVPPNTSPEQTRLAIDGEHIAAMWRDASGVSWCRHIYPTLKAPVQVLDFVNDGTSHAEPTLVELPDGGVLALGGGAKVGDDDPPAYRVMPDGIYTPGTWWTEAR